VRKLIKYFIINCVSLYLVSIAVSGLVFEDGIQTLVLAGIALGVGSIIVRPIINILLLPINLITFGLFRWVSFSLVLYVVTLLVKGFKITDFVFGGFTSYWISVPSFQIPGVAALIVFSFVISIVSSVLDWLLK